MHVCVCERERGGERERVCVYVCVCGRESVNVCVYVCARERERELTHMPAWASMQACTATQGKWKEAQSFAITPLFLRNRF